MRTFRRAEVIVWASCGAVLLMVAVTYARLDPAELYHVTRRGLAGGLSRMLVETNFSVALVAIALVLVAMHHLPMTAWWFAGPAIVLCALTVAIVDEDDLDARLVNALPAVGVAMALALSIRSIERSDPPATRAPMFDRARVLIGVLVGLVSIPWIAADLGVFLPERLFAMRRVITYPDGTMEIAVHLGHHHGLDGLLMVLTALLLSRLDMQGGGLRTATRLYLSLLFAYGIVNLTEDAWNEQIVGRGWTAWHMPSASTPGIDVMWLVIVALTAATAFGLSREVDRA